MNVMCFAGVREGFLAACRPIFGLDGTFLEGAAGGVLLTAVGVDPNNGLYPIAYAAAEEETKDSWIWFLNLLGEDLKIQKDYEWAIMSDKQKGLIQACEIIFQMQHTYYVLNICIATCLLLALKGQQLGKLCGKQLRPPLLHNSLEEYRLLENLMKRQLSG